MRQNPPPQTSAANSAAPLSLAYTQRWAAQPVPGVKRKLWRRDDEHAHLADQAFAPVRDGVLKRDNYSCRFCGFKAAKYQEVHHLDDNHANNDPANLLTVCNLCHQVHHMGLCGMHGAAFLADLPYLTQTEVNSLVRAIFVGQMVADQAVRDRLTGLYALFRAKSDSLKSLYDMDISSPLLYGQLFSTDDDLYDNRKKLLQSLRLVPTKEAFHQAQLEYYAVNVRTQFLAENWGALARQLMVG